MAKQIGKFSKQTFILNAPTARKVALVGDFTNWQSNPILLKKGEDGIWSVTLALPAGNHNYRFIVDGEWHDDPRCPLRAPNPYGSFNMVRQVV